MSKLRLEDVYMYSFEYLSEFGTRFVVHDGGSCFSIACKDLHIDPLKVSKCKEYTIRGWEGGSPILSHKDTGSVVSVFNLTEYQWGKLEEWISELNYKAELVLSNGIVYYKPYSNAELDRKSYLSILYTLERCINTHPWYKKIWLGIVEIVRRFSRYGYL